MKIAIMTHPLGRNYGGIMQAWALQQVLKNAGHEPVTIDRVPDGDSPVYNVARLGYRTVKKILGKRRGPISFERHLPYILQGNYAFIENNIRVSEEINSTAELKKHFRHEQYDAVIVGSDQTWRPSYSPNIGNCFLDFLQDSDIKRIAYASSFGVDEWEFTEEQTRSFIPLAKQFDAIGVREDSGVGLCKKHLGVEAVQVLDPTLLIERQAYEALYKTKDLPTRGGVYTYILDQAEWKDKIVEAVKKQLNKPKYSNQPKTCMGRPNSGSLEDYKMPSIEGWIKAFADAEFIITDSFHGTVFSILFNKPFISLLNKNRGASRFYSILKEFGFMDRVLTEYDLRKVFLLQQQEINWFEVNNKLYALKAKSIDFLKSNLNWSNVVQ